MSKFLKTICSLKFLENFWLSRKLSLFGVLSFFGLTLFLLVLLTKQRNSFIDNLVEAKNFETSPISTPMAVNKSSSFKDNKEPRISPQPKSADTNIWCEVRDYKDLSKDPSIVLFQQWIEDFSELTCLHDYSTDESESCLVHDPRILSKMMKVGEKLAVERKPIFSQIIRGDPEKALNLAISPEIIDRLPKEISDHLEKWESDFINILALNVCYDPLHSNLIVRRAEFRDERKYRLWSFGSREKITTKENISAWGISLGDDFAMSDQPFRVEKTDSDSGSVKVGDLSISFSHKAEKDWISYQLTKAERRGLQAVGKMSYPIVMGSEGATIERNKYEIRPPATFADAYQDALDKNASLLVIETEDEHEEVLLFIKSQLGEISSELPSGPITGSLNNGNSNGSNSRGENEDSDTNDSLVWLGLTDDNETNGSSYTPENGSVSIPIDASEGNWTWMSGNLAVNGYQNWRQNYPSTSTNNNFAAMEWNATNVTNSDGNDSNGTWIDVNGSLKLRYVIEYDLPETESIQVELKGFRKFLVIPARWMDETDHFTSSHNEGPNAGTNNPSTNYLGESINEEIQADPFDAITRFNLEETMDAVSEFYSRNTDRELVLTPVITSTVTLPFYKGFSSVANDDENATIFDTDGNFTQYNAYNINDEYGLISEVAYGAKKLAAQESERWDMDSPAFQGVAILRLAGSLISASYDRPPEVEIRGGAFINPETLEPHPHFKAAEAEVILDESGNITNIKLLNPGEFYFPEDFGIGVDDRAPPESLGLTIFDWNYITDPDSPHNVYLELCKLLDTNGDGWPEWPEPEVLINGDNQFDSQFELYTGNLCVTFVCLTTGDAGGVGGLGTVGGMGSWVNISSGQSSPTLTIHEMGHNFGLNHSQRYESYSEKSISDEGLKIDYGNPYSVMGGAEYGDFTGDFTLVHKAFLPSKLGVGLNRGVELGSDIVNLSLYFDINGIGTSTTDFEEADSPDNTFRIYRSDFDSPPRFLKIGHYYLNMPEFESNLTRRHLQISSPINLLIFGTGEEANGTITEGPSGEFLLNITDGGRGFVEQPNIIAIDENGSEILSINPTWITVANGITYRSQADLLDYDYRNRWVRGIVSETFTKFRLEWQSEPWNLAPESMKLPFDEQLTDYYLSYRKDVTENGVSLLMATSGTINDLVEGFLLDATPQTPGIIEDAPLFLGCTYSDYSADRHFTPIRKGGSDEMPWIEVVVHHYTLYYDEAKAPEFSFSVSNKSPEPGEYVQFSAMVEDGNTSNYAYSWYINEQFVDDPTCLNQPSIYKAFTQPGKYVVRVVVSDMKGGISSRNLEITVVGEESQNLSTVSGNVRSTQGNIQGARVLIEQAPLVEHTVSVVGDLKHSFFVNGKDEPLRYQIDGQTNADLFMRRGEVHRFYFDSSTREYPLTFIEEPENSPSRVRVNMLTDARVDINKGDQYVRSPNVSYKLNSGFASYLSNQVGDYYTMLQFIDDDNDTISSIEDTNGTILSVLQDLSENNRTNFDQPNLITRPYPRAIMQETNISSATVGPTTFGETGFVTFGGRGYSFANVPTVKVRRASIWENYENPDANATAKVDGVNTISPVIAEEFLGDTWKTRPGDTIIPDLKVWGSGGGDLDDRYSEVNASIDGWTSDTGDYMRTITILNQGKGFEPNSTMAVLHYPIEPHAYWTFDRHETLFEDKREARHQPSPAWNREINVPQLFHYWTFDNNDSGVFDLESNVSLSEDKFQSLGLLGNALQLNNAELNASRFLDTLDQNFTLSMWVKPSGDFNISISDSDSSPTQRIRIGYDSNLQKFTGIVSGNEGNPFEISPEEPDYWAHVAIVCDEEKTKLYLNGRESVDYTASSFDSVPNLRVFTTGEGDLFLDELKIYDTSLTDTAVRYLAGISFLDLSGNKFHATPEGDGDSLFLTVPDANMSSTDVPTETPFLNSVHGSGSLGDSFSGEDNGKSLSLDGISQYLDLDNHVEKFGLVEGTISVWIKPNSQDTSPIFSLGFGYDTIDNNGTAELSATGSLFSLELTSGYPRLAGFRTIGNDFIQSEEWSHLVATFPIVQFWINGEEAPAQVITSASAEFEEATDLLDLSITAEFFRVGYSYDRFALSQTDELPTSPPETYFDGHLDDLAVYNRILSSEEVSYLYDLRMGREQTPRLEAFVDAVGTVEIIEGGEGYRENPDLVFWYGDVEESENLPESFDTYDQMEANFTDGNGDINGTFGQLVYIEDEKTVYSLYLGNDDNHTYKGRLGEENGWRVLLSASGLGEFENASLADVVWAKRMDDLVDVPMPDGRKRPQRLVDYVTMDRNYSTPLESNGSMDTPYYFYQPKGLYGFIEQLVFDVSSPEEYNEYAVVGNRAEVYSFFYLDHESNDSVTIVDYGEGTPDLNTDQVQVFGPGYQPKGIGGEEQEWPDAQIDTKTEGGDPVITSVFGGFNHYDWNGTHDIHLDESRYQVKKRVSSISVEDAGFGYSMPCEVKVVGGFPQFTNSEYNDTFPDYADSINETNKSSPRYDFQEANITVLEIDQNGGILDLNVTGDRGGRGYVPYYYSEATDPIFGYWPSPGDDHPHGGNDLGVFGYPIIIVTGGGGQGAIFLSELDENGTIIGAEPAMDKFGNQLRGQGYFNYESTNKPTAHLTSNVPPTESASLKVRLGGYLKEIPPCTACQSGEHSSLASKYSHLEPWVEIWDRGRPEAEIDQKGLRAHGAPKIVNGQIKKIVVTKSGEGYVDPVAIVRDVSPKNGFYWDGQSGQFRRKWVCSFMRLSKDGRKEMCGHVHWGHLPPEECPGETDEQLPNEDENGTIIYATGDEIQAWRKRHDDTTDSPNREHYYCTHETGSDVRDSHLNANFVTRKCWGTKFTFLLDENNSYYRNPSTDWMHLDANLTVVTKEGKITEIIVDNPETNGNYFASQITIQGTGSEVDAIPVFDEYGINTQVIFDDPRLKNIELDQIERPHGAGQGFRERPWSWDDSLEKIYPSEYVYPDKVQVWAHHSEVVPSIQLMQNPYGPVPPEMTPVWKWNFGDPILADNLGDRILEVEVLNRGDYNNTTGTLSIDIEFNNSVVMNVNGVNVTSNLDLNQDGQDDFREANLTAHLNHFLTDFYLDSNGTYEDNTSGETIERGLFLEDPAVYILDGSMLREVGPGVKLADATGAYGQFAYPKELNSSFIRLNEFKEEWQGKEKLAQYGLLKYDPEQDRSYVDLYVDDLFPNEFYYGFGITDPANDAKTVFPKMGGKIYVSESLPGMNWAINEPRGKDTQFSYTDINGYYALPNLEPGLYNISVFMEDKQFRESTFRPEEDKQRVSQILYVPGFPELVLETDNSGQGISSLVWSQHARDLSRPSDPKGSATSEYDQEFRLRKKLDGIGKGFDPNGPVPQLIFVPGIDNISKVTPNVSVEILVDGSLSLRIVDDLNTSKYFPHDRFLVRYSSSVSGVDFMESFLYSESNVTFGSGSLGSGTVGQPHLVILPGESNGTNFLEVPLSRKGTIQEFQIIQEGSGYTTGDKISVTSAKGYGLEASLVVNAGSVVDVNITNGGFGYSLEDEFSIVSPGQDAVLKPILISDRPYTLQAFVHDANGSIVNSVPVDWNLFFDFNSSDGNNSRLAELNSTSGNDVALNLYSTLRRHHGSIKSIEILSGGTGYDINDTIDFTSINGYGFEAKVFDINDSSGAITEISISQNGFDYLEEDVAEINSTSGFGAVIQPVFYDGYLTIEANSSINGHNVSSKIKIRASMRDVLTQQEKWLDKYVDSVLEQNSTWWQEDAKITVSLPSGYLGELFYFCTSHPVMSRKLEIQQDINTIKVSGGQTSAPYYQFQDSNDNNISFDDFKLIAGETYEFVADGVSSDHPFTISEVNQSSSSNLASGDPLTGSSGIITVTLPSGYSGDLFYFCTNHPVMSQAFPIQQDIKTIKVSDASLIPPYYQFHDSNDDPINILTFKLLAGETYEFIADDINISHPFMISDQNGSLTSSLSIGGPLTGSKSVTDLDDDNLSNFEEWIFGSNPTRQDTDLDTLTDFQELSFQSNPIRIDTDYDGATDAEEFAKGSDAQDADSDGDGLLDGEDDSPNDSSGVGVISGRIFMLDKYSDIGAKTFYRFAESNETSDWNATNDWLSSTDSNWKGGPDFFYQEGLFYDRNYTIQVYLEIDDINASDPPYYNEGEPFIEHSVPLTSNVYGLQLLPVDRIPELHIDPDFKSLEIDINGTNQTEVYEWEIDASDPYYSNSWTMDSNLSDRGIVLEGNFTPYLIGIPSSGYEYSSTMNINLELVPPGTYSLFYKAYDSFQNFSETEEQTITIFDRQAPFLTVIDFVNNIGVTTENNETIAQVYSEYNSTVFTYLDQQNATAELDWLMGTPFKLSDLFIEARDNKSGVAAWSATYNDDSFDSLPTNAPYIYELNFTTEDDAGNIASLILNLNIVDDHAPEVSLSGQSIDENNTIESYRGRGFFLEDEVQIIADDSYQSYQSELLEYESNSSSFNDVDWDGLTVIQTDGKTLILPGDDSNYTITFSFTDESNNTGFASLIVLAKDPAWSIQGKAIDGYLKDSTVQFVSSDYGPSAVTNEDGSFTLYFTDEEMELFDFNGDGSIGADEGTMIVSGGIDIDTNASFLGELRANAESEIISPLTSILSFMVNQGFRREVAEARIIEAFGLDISVNIGVFDPYEEIDNQNPNASAVLLANLRLANAINIPEAILLAAGDDTFESGDISRSLFSQIAQEIGKGSGEADFQSIIDNVLPVACESLALSVPFDSAEVSAISSIIEKADPSSLQPNTLNSLESKEALVGSQIWVKENILDEMQRILISDAGILDIVTLEDITPPISISEVDELVYGRRSNLHNPSGKNFKTFFSPSILEDDCIWKLETNDGDGDSVYHTLLAGNYDFDGDGLNALKLEPDGRLCVEDYDDLRQLAGSTLNLEIELDDMRGGNSLMMGQLAVKNLLTWDSSQIESSWYQSDWLGSFYSTEGSWVYHHPIGWLYVHPDGQDGFWFWDHNWNLWWWSKKRAFPWIYRDDSAQWDYLMVLPDGINVFDLKNRRWRRRE